MGKAGCLQQPPSPSMSQEGVGPVCWVPSAVCAGTTCSPQGAACLTVGERHHNPKPRGSKTTMKHTKTLISQGQILWFAVDFPLKLHCSRPKQCHSPHEHMLLTRVAGKIPK